MYVQALPGKISIGRTAAGSINRTILFVAYRYWARLYIHQYCCTTSVLYWQQIAQDTSISYYTAQNCTVLFNGHNKQSLYYQGILSKYLFFFVRYLLNRRECVRSHISQGVRILCHRVGCCTDSGFSLTVVFCISRCVQHSLLRFCAFFSRNLLNSHTDRFMVGQKCTFSTFAAINEMPVGLEVRIPDLQPQESALSLSGRRGAYRILFCGVRLVPVVFVERASTMLYRRGVKGPEERYYPFRL